MRRHKNTIRKRKWPFLLVAVLFFLSGCASQQSAKAPPGKTETPQQRAIMDINASEDDEMAKVMIRANQPLTYTAVKHQFPLAVVLYFPDTSLGGIDEQMATDGNSIVSTIHSSALERTRPSSRVEIRLQKDVPYKVARTGSEVVVLFKKGTANQLESPKVSESRPPAAGHDEKKDEIIAAKPAEAVKPVLVPSKDDTSSTITKAGTPPTLKVPVAGDMTVLKRIDFENLEKGKSRLTIETDKKASWETVKSSDKRLLIKFYDTYIPKFQKRPLITTRFDSAVDRVLPIQTEKMGKTAVFAVELRESVPYRTHVARSGNIYMVDFERSSVPARPMPEAEKAAWIQAMNQAEETLTTEVISKQKPAEVIETESGKVYAGEKISLDFQDADIHNIFRILHEVSGRNFVIGSDVKGRVTLKLVNVPWDQVLDLILHMNKLGTVAEGNVVRIATLATLEAEQKAIASQKKAEEAAKELEPLTTRYVKLNYAKASDLQVHLKELKSTRGKVTIDDGTNMIILNDEKESLEKSMVLIKELDEAKQEIATRQVMIEARIVEADSSFTRDIGVKWGGDYESSGNKNSYQLFGGSQFDNYQTALPNYAVNLPPASQSSGLGFTFGRIAGVTVNLDVRLLAMENQGRGRTISSPKILTLDNQEATIKQVTKIPYQVIEDNTVSIKQEEAGVVLSVTPQITRDERIRMKIFAEKGQPDFSNTVGGNPAIDTNTADTELFVNNGQTIVIGGILTTEDTESSERTPFFHSIPVFGWLFKQKKTVRNKDELLIFITPKIIRLEENLQSGG